MLKRILTRAIILFALAPAYNAQAATTLPEDTHKAVILSYMRVGDDAQPDSNITTEQFKSHLALIEHENYTVLSLPDALQRIQTGASLPPKSIILTFDGAYRSAYNNALEILIAKKLPFTVFYNFDAADRDYPEYLNWDALKKLKRSPLVTLGVLPSLSEHLSHQASQEFTSELNIARQKHREHFKEEAIYLAYPYGEYSAALREAVQSRGFEAAFGQQSGAVHTGADLLTLPRFTMTERYGDEDRFDLIANALPLPAKDILPKDPYIKSEILQMGFTLPEALQNETDQLACFAAGAINIETEVFGNRIEIRSLDAIGNIGRLRINCTMPGPVDSDGQEQWRWFSVLLHQDLAASGIYRSNNPAQDALQPPQE